VNITISIDDALLERARRLAHQQGTSVQELLRRYLASLVGEASGEEVTRELLDLMEQEGGRSGGAPFRRADAYEGRL
jgi:hypothetical protein